MSVKKTLLIICGLSFAAQIAVADHSWGAYHWARSTNPLVKVVNYNLTGLWPDHFFVANDDWNVSTVLSLYPLLGNVKSLRRCSPSSGEIQVCNEAYGNNGWLGIAGISVKGEHIEAGYVKLNDTYFKSPAYDSPAWRQSVMCQELGHIWGLGHNDENFYNPSTGTCMDYSTNPTANQKPDSHDYVWLEKIYAHLDGGSSSDDGSNDGGCNPRSPKCDAGNVQANGRANQVLDQLDLNGPEQWGRRISDHGSIEVFELDLGNGRKIITTVTWTIERAGLPHDDH
jgi:hypothetical protein